MESLGETREAAARGADRVELCIDLARDGCTPPLSLVSACCTVGLPVVAMVRPRPGQFSYRRAEIAAMCDSVRDLVAAGASGVATGALAGSRIDLAATSRLVAAAGAVPVTFHRAFDALGDLDAGLDALIAHGVRRVLTAGGAPSAMDGLRTLRRLVDRAAGRIEIVAAGGVRPHTVARILDETGAPAVHARWTGWRNAGATRPAS